MSRIEDNEQASWFIEPERPGRCDLDRYSERYLSAPDGEELLEVALLWRGHLLCVQAYHAPQRVLIGPGRSCDLVMEGLVPLEGGQGHPLLEAHEGRWHLALVPALSGVLSRSDGARMAADVAMERWALAPHPELGGAQLVPMGPEGVSSARFDLGEVTLLVRLGDAEARAGRLGPIDVAPLPYLGGSAALHACLLGLILTMPAGAGASFELEQVGSPSDRIVRAVVVPPQAPPRPLPDGSDLQGDGEDARIGLRHEGVEGAAGALESAATSTGRVAVERRAEAEAEPVEVAARAHQTEAPVSPAPGVERAGALAVLEGQGELLGRADETQGEDERSALGALREAELGEARGELGLGTSGQGPGAGGASGHSVGIARDFAARSARRGGRGVAPRLERRAAQAEQLFVEPRDQAETQGRGCLTQEIIRRAVRRRRNQIRACYEDALLDQRELRGDIEVQLRIAPSGRVVGFDVRRDTTGAPGIARCIERKLSTLAFPAFDQCDAVIVNYPFRFHPRQLLWVPTRGAR